MRATNKTTKIGVVSSYVSHVDLMEKLERECVGPSYGFRVFSIVYEQRIEVGWWHAFYEEAE